MQPVAPAVPASALAQQYTAIRHRSTAVCDGLSGEDCALQSMPDASPLKWHLAHTTWFWETFVLLPAMPGFQVFDPAFRTLFNSYYNRIGEQFPRPQRGLLSRPDLATVMAYRRHVDAAMQALLAGPSIDATTAATIELGLNHEQQHQELMLTDFKDLLSINPLRPVYRPHRQTLAAIDEHPPAVGSAWIDFAEGTQQIGHQGNGFAFDNELPRHTVWLAPFSIGRRLVTNSDYLAFIGDGGYDNADHWLSEGFAWRAQQRWQAPLHWRRVDGQWLEFTLHGERPVVGEAPVCHLSFYEADAYARYAGARLPTEFEWEHAASPPPEGTAAVHRLHPEPAVRRTGKAADALLDLYDQVWQWTSSSYAPYPGFCASADAVGEYNGKFMVNQYVLRGGSCLTSPGHPRRSYRNFFPASARWQMTGLRLARSNP